MKQTASGKVEWGNEVGECGNKAKGNGKALGMRWGGETKLGMLERKEGASLEVWNLGMRWGRWG